jgi:hypothetical protein
VVSKLLLPLLLLKLPLPLPLRLLLLLLPSQLLHLLLQSKKLNRLDKKADASRLFCFLHFPGYQAISRHANPRSCVATAT